MLREKLISKGIGDDLTFRWRCHEISRIEGPSDAVFAFAVTLLVVSLEVPKTFAELKGMTYALTPVVMTLHGVLNGRKRRKLEECFTSGIGFLNPERADQT